MGSSWKWGGLLLILGGGGFYLLGGHNPLREGYGVYQQYRQQVANRAALQQGAEAAFWRQQREDAEWFAYYRPNPA